MLPYVSWKRWSACSSAGEFGRERGGIPDGWVRGWVDAADACQAALARRTDSRVRGMHALARPSGVSGSDGQRVWWGAVSVLARIGRQPRIAGVQRRPAALPAPGSLRHPSRTGGSRKAPAVRRIRGMHAGPWRSRVPRSAVRCRYRDDRARQSHPGGARVPSSGAQLPDRIARVSRVRARLIGSRDPRRRDPGRLSEADSVGQVMRATGPNSLRWVCP